MRWIVLILLTLVIHIYLLLTQIAPSLLVGQPVIRWSNYSADQAAWGWFVMSLTVSFYGMIRIYRREARYRRIQKARQYRRASRTSVQSEQM